MESDPQTRRVALVGPTHPAPGGIVHFTAGLADALARRYPTLVIGWRRRFPARLYPGTVNDEVSETPVSATGERLLDLFDPRTWRAAAGRIRDFGADLVVLQWWHPMHAPVLVALMRRMRRVGIPVVVVCHNVEPHETNPAWRALTRYALRRADGLVVHAAALHDAAAAVAPDVPITDAFLPVFGNVAEATGPADPALVSELRDRVGARDRPLLVTFGYVRPYKGVADAIAAMAHLRADAVLVVAGECWDDADRYRRAAEAAGVAGRVVLDFRYVPNDEIPVLFAAADAVVLPYRTATQSAVAALAFAFDRPVVATRTGGLPELVEDDVTGALATAGDPVDLAAAIDRVLDDPRDWSPAIARTRERLSWGRYVEVVFGDVRPRRDPRTHAVLDPASRRGKAAKIIRILEGERPLAGARVLDVGTGSGTIAAELATTAGDGRVVSVDTTDVRVEGVGYEFRRLDGPRLPFEDGAFDIVVSNHVVEHVGGRVEQQRHLDELARVLAPGGVAYVAAPNRWRLVENHYRLPFLSWLPGPVADRYMRVTGRGERYDCRLVTRTGLLRMLRSAGLTPRDATPDLVRATADLDAGISARVLRHPPARAFVRGPLLPTVVAVGRKPEASAAPRPSGRLPLAGGR